MYDCLEKTGNQHLIASGYLQSQVICSERGCIKTQHRLHSCYRNIWMSPSWAQCAQLMCWIVLIKKQIC